MFNVMLNPQITISVSQHYLPTKLIVSIPPNTYCAYIPSIVEYVDRDILSEEGGADDRVPS